MATWSAQLQCTTLRTVFLPPLSRTACEPPGAGDYMIWLYTYEHINEHCARSWLQNCWKRNLTRPPMPSYLAFEKLGLNIFLELFGYMIWYDMIWYDIYIYIIFIYTRYGWDRSCRRVQFFWFPISWVKYCFCLLKVPNSYLMWF